MKDSSKPDYEKVYRVLIRESLSCAPTDANPP
jgi:hypothetical protein